MSVEERNARIESTMLGFEDHGILTFMLHLNYGHEGQGYGGYALKHPAIGLGAIERILRTVGVSTWENLPGKYIRVRADSGKVYAIAPALEGEWLDIAAPPAGEQREEDEG